MGRRPIPVHDRPAIFAATRVGSVVFGWWLVQGGNEQRRRWQLSQQPNTGRNDDENTKR
jgi:hypothetical protein